MSKKLNFQFGLLLSFIILTLFLYNFIKNNIFELTFIILFSITFCITLFKPNLLNIFTFLWLKIGLFLGHYMSIMMMIVVFYFLITPLSLTSKLFQKDFLNLKFKKSDKTYWINKTDKNMNLDKQF